MQKLTIGFRSRFLLSLGLCLALLGGAAQAQQSRPEVDAKLKKLLEKTRIPFKVREDGNFEVLVSVPSLRNRTQAVLLTSEKANTEGFESRLLYTKVYQSPHRLTQSQSERLLIANLAALPSAYVVFDQEGFYIVRLMSYIPVDLDAKQLKSMLEEAARQADRTEQELTNADDF